MVSEDLGSNKNIFVQFPPLEEDHAREDGKDSGSETESGVKAGPGEIFGTVRPLFKRKDEPPEKTGTRERTERRDQEDQDSSISGSSLMMTPPENDKEKEWYPL